MYRFHKAFFLSLILSSTAQGGKTLEEELNEHLKFYGEFMGSEVSSLTVEEEQRLCQEIGRANAKKKAQASPQSSSLAPSSNNILAQQVIALENAKRVNNAQPKP